jgi:hypothetical protein
MDPGQTAESACERGEELDAGVCAVDGGNHEGQIGAPGNRGTAIPAPIVVVAGCPRSGTSMMMAMLHAGGIEPYCDPEDVGHGYEAHEVAWLPSPSTWIRRCAGKAVKILDPHRHTPPPGYPYRVVFMVRDVDQQAQSLLRFTRKFVGTRVRVGIAGLPKLRASLRRDVARGQELMRALDPKLLVVPFENVLSEPLWWAFEVLRHATRPDGDVPFTVDLERVNAMARVVRDRGPKALRRPAELELARGGR